MSRKSYAIIGGGIIGSAIARAIGLDDLGDVVVLEKENELGKHQSGRNSGVLHSGVVQAYLASDVNSLKVKMCVEGSRKAKRFCGEYNVAFQECGTLFLARSEEEKKELEVMLFRGDVAGIEGLKMLSNYELACKEPALDNGYETTALFAPSGAIVDSAGFLKAIANDAECLGVKYVFDFPVARIEKNTGGFALYSKNEHEVFVDHIINAAGLYADKIAHMMGTGLEFEVIPFRGEYMEVSGLKIRSMAYHVPDKRFPFLGVHLTPTIDGKVIAGPTAALSFGRESYNGEFDWKETKEMLHTQNFWRMALNPGMIGLYFKNRKISKSERAFLREIQVMAPAVERQDISPCRSGIRAQIVDRKGKMCNDFIVDFQPNSTHILNAVSPGMTCALPFAEYVVAGIKFYGKERRVPSPKELFERMYFSGSFPVVG